MSTEDHYPIYTTKFGSYISKIYLPTLQIDSCLYYFFGNTSKYYVIEIIIKDLCFIVIKTELSGITGPYTQIF